MPAKLEPDERKRRAYERTKRWRAKRKNEWSFREQWRRANAKRRKKQKVAMQKKRSRTKNKPVDKPPLAPKKDPTGELEYSPLDGIDTAYAEPGANNGTLTDRTLAESGERVSERAPAGIDDPLNGLDPIAEPQSLEVAASAGIQEPAEFLEDLEAGHKRAMLEHLRKDLEASYDRDKERLRQSFGQGKV